MRGSRVTAGGFWIQLQPAPMPAVRNLPAQVAGIGGPVGITVDGRSAPVYSGEWVKFRYGLAPQNLATYRQLAAAGLRPGGAQPVAELSWWHGSGTRIAYLYDVKMAVPQRPMTPAKKTALAKAMLAKRTCPSCSRDVGYVIPTSLGRCVDCEYGPIEHPGDQAATDRRGVA